MSRHAFTISSALPFLSLFGVAACGSHHGGTATTTPVGSNSSTLMQAAISCADIDVAIREQIRASLRLQYAQGQTCGGRYSSTGTNGGTTGVAVRGSASAGAGGSAAFGGAKAAAPSVGLDMDDGSQSSAGEPSAAVVPPHGETAALPSSTTTTNTQVAGVDEADFVKSDGKNLYVLHDQVLELVQAWPVEALGGKAGIALEGAPREMFVVGDAATDATRKVVVIAEVDAAAVYAKAGLADASEQKVATGGGTAGSMVGVTGPAIRVAVGGTGGSTYVPAYDAGAGGAGGSNSTAPDYRGAKIATPPSEPALGVTQPGVWSGSARMTKVTILDATDSSLVVSSQMYYDGAYQSSRRQGSRVHAVLGIEKSWPTLDTCATSAERLKAEMVVLHRLSEQKLDVEALSAEEIERQVLDELVDIVLLRNKTSLDSISYADYVPHRFSYDGVAVSADTLACDRMYLPKAGSSAWGVTYVAEIDLAAPHTDPGSRAILGRASILYENGTAMVLASNSSESRPYPEGWTEVAYVHRFGLTPAGLAYEGSAQVDGRLKDQFSLDVKADALRAVISKGSRLSQKNRLEVFKGVNEAGLLQTAGVVGGIGDGEDVRSVRYVGDTAFVVTFVQTDPLYTIDLSNPAQPRIAGELPDIPGFSTYMHPIDDNHLLTIGYENGTNMLQIFDVTDKSKAATQLAKYSLDSTGTSLAASEYKAFTYYPEQKLLAIPFVSYSKSPHAAMLVYSIDLVQGIQFLGSVDGDFITGMPANSNMCYFYGSSDSAFSRSVFFDQVLYAVAQRGIAAVQARAPGEVLGRLVFPAAQSQMGYGCDISYKEPWGGAGGAAGSPIGAGGVGVGMAGSPQTAGTAFVGGAGGFREAGGGVPMEVDAGPSQQTGGSALGDGGLDGAAETAGWGGAGGAGQN